MAIISPNSAPLTPVISELTGFAVRRIQNAAFRMPFAPCQFADVIAFAQQCQRFQKLSSSVVRLQAQNSRKMWTCYPKLTMV
jgi:hypothetical protein